MDIRDVPLHLPGAHFIAWLQEICWPLREQVMVASRLGDPASAYGLMFPLAFALSRALGRRVLWTAIVGEWLSLLLKTLLRGQRPYWWVAKSPLWHDGPPLKQFEITCETGFGSPSGHAMVSAAVWYQLAAALYAIASKRCRSSLIHWWIWIVYGVCLLAVSVSRLFIATHFPHQVVLGAFCGVVLARWISTFSSPLSRAGVSFHVAIAVLLAGGVYVIYFLLLLFGVDPSSSVTLALQHCAHANWVHLDTTPFFSVFRVSGSIIGLGVMSLLSSNDRRPHHRSPVFHCATVFSSLLAAQLLLRAPLPVITSNAVFYAVSFLRFTVLPGIVQFFIQLTERAFQ